MGPRDVQAGKRTSLWRDCERVRASERASETARESERACREVLRNTSGFSPGV